MRITFDTDNLKRKFEENPAMMIGAVAALSTGLAKLMNANTARKNSKTWKQEVARRNRK